MRRIILIVDDSRQYSGCLEIALASIPGVQVAFASSGVEAIEFLEGSQGQEVKALVTDLNMPAMDGFELIERVRARPRTPRLPIVVVSGDPDPDAPARSLRLGADAFFPKPYSPAEIRSKLEQFLDGNQKYP